MLSKERACFYAGFCKIGQEGRALKPWGFTYQVEDLVKTLEVEAAGGTQIDYKDQDPEIHQTFVNECSKRGVEVRLKF